MSCFGCHGMCVCPNLCEARPTRRPRVGPMTQNRVFLIILVLIAAVWGIAHFARDAHGATRPATPADCQRLWESLPPGQRFPVKQRCLASIVARECRSKPRLVPASVRVKGVRVDSGQRHVLSWIVSEGLRRRKATRVIVLSAIMATTQESSARELTHGEGTSVGPFQLIDSHGSFTQRVSVEFSGKWYYDRAVRMYYRGEDPAHLAQKVEASAFPSAYQQWSREAARTLPAILGPCKLRS